MASGVDADGPLEHVDITIPAIEQQSESKRRRHRHRRTRNGASPDGSPAQVDDADDLEGGDAEPLLPSKDWRLDNSKFLAEVKPHQEMKLMGRKVSAFYRKQNALVESYLELEATELDNSKEKKEDRLVKFAIYLSFVTNLVLFALTLFAAISSMSLAVIAAALDSFLDLLSGSIIFVTSRLMRSSNVYKYPAGKSRLEPLGIIVFASCMFVATLYLIIQSLQALLGGDRSIDVDVITYACIGITVVSKALLFVFCKVMERSSASCGTLAQDHRNDVITKSLGLMFAALAGRYPEVGWLDAAGAIFLGSWLLFNWGSTIVEHVKMMAGKSAPPELLSQLTYLCWNHSEKILAIDTVRAFHFALGFLVEVDIVLPEDMLLREAHDIGEALQIRLEMLSHVERAYVHLDYEHSHKPEHALALCKTHEDVELTRRGEEAIKSVTTCGTINQLPTVASVSPSLASSKETVA